METVLNDRLIGVSTPPIERSGTYQGGKAAKEGLSPAKAQRAPRDIDFRI
jgi:hypothetical protein